MKSIVPFLLLVSLGLNLGLGYKLLRSDVPPFPGERMWERGENFRDAPGRRGKDGGDHMFWQKMMDRRLDHMSKRLDLTPEQAVAFQGRHREAFELVVNQRFKVHAARGHLQFLIAGGAVDSDSVRAAINNISREQSRMDSLVTETVLSEMEILDDSQRALYLEILPLNRGFGPGSPQGGGRNRRDR